MKTVFLSIAASIEENHIELRRVINSELVTLFWETGRTLNAFDSFEPLKKGNAEAFFKGLFGRHIHYYSFGQMQAFARYYPKKDDMLSIAAILDWDHIEILMQFPDKIQRGYLLYEMISNTLSLNNCKKNSKQRIDDKYALSKGKNGNIIDNKLYNQILGNQTRANPLLKNPFTDIYLLNDICVNIDIKIKNDKKDIKSQEPLFTVFKESNLSFRRWLHGHLAIACWHIGRKVNASFDSLKAVFLNFDDYLKQFVFFHKTEIGIPISVNTLKILSGFASQVQLEDAARYIGFHTNWSQLKILLLLPGAEQKIFYAKKIAEENWSNKKLKNSIAENQYVHSPGSTVQMRKYIKSMRTEEPNGDVIINLGENIDKPTPKFKNIIKSPCFELLRN